MSEERRTRALQTRRTLRPQDMQDLARLDPLAVDQVQREAWPVVRDEEELHDALLQIVAMPPQPETAWQGWFAELQSRGRAVEVHLGQARWWVASEHWTALQAVHENICCEPALRLPPALEQAVDRTEAIARLVRGRMQFAGPCSAKWLSEQLCLPVHQVSVALEALEGQGIVLRGNFLTSAERDGDQIDWCDRRLLARIHRLTMDGLRRQIRPVSTATFLQFLVQRHRLNGRRVWAGQVGLREVLQLLQGFQMPAGAWERCLGMRMDGYDEQWLDYMFLSGEVTWGRLCLPRRGEETPAPAGALALWLPGRSGGGTPCCLSRR